MTPAPDDDAVVEIDCTPYLTPEQRTWPVVRPVAVPEPPLVTPALAVSLAGPAGADAVVDLILRASRAEQALGGRGLTLAGREEVGGVLTLTLNPVATDPGAAARLRAVAADLGRTAGLTAAVRPAA